MINDPSNLSMNVSFRKERRVRKLTGLDDIIQFPESLVVKRRWNDEVDASLPHLLSAATDVGRVESEMLDARTAVFRDEHVDLVLSVDA